MRSTRCGGERTGEQGRTRSICQLCAFRAEQVVEATGPRCPGARGNRPRPEAGLSSRFLVLMTDEYLQSTWCTDERDWFVQQTRAGHPVFVVRVQLTEDHTWPVVFKDGRGYPLRDYDFIGDPKLQIQKGHPTFEGSPDDSKPYYAELRKLATDIVEHMKTLQRVPRKRSKRRYLSNDLQEEQAAFVGAYRRIFIMAGPRDNALKEEIRQLIEEFGISVSPVILSSDVARDVNSIVDENGFLNVLQTFWMP
jgi:hypothetical protein